MSFHTDTFTSVVWPACSGEEKTFRSVKQKDMWKRLHFKTCSICANANKTVYQDQDFSKKAPITQGEILADIRKVMVKQREFTSS